MPAGEKASFTLPAINQVESVRFSVLLDRLCENPEYRERGLLPMPQHSVLSWNVHPVGKFNDKPGLSIFVSRVKFSGAVGMAAIEACPVCRIK